MSADRTYYPSYAWVGAPTVYNGTGGDGGDSGKISTPRPQYFLNVMDRSKGLIFKSISCRKLESMVFSW